MFLILVVPAISLVFYILVPGIGAFRVRRSWRLFREKLNTISMMPLIRYGQIKSRNGLFKTGYRFIGEVQALEGDDSLWISDGSLSVKVVVPGALIYTLPSLPRQEHDLDLEESMDLFPDERPRAESWPELGSLQEGTKIVVGGMVEERQGMPCFISQPQDPLFILFFDESPETVLYHSILNGRQKNEYWNRMTPASLGGGSFLLFFLAYFIFQTEFPPLAVVVTVTAALFPVIPFLPPGILFFTLYRRFWRRGRRLRAERDLISLPLRFFGRKTASVPRREGGEIVSSGYRMKRVSDYGEVRRLGSGYRYRDSSLKRAAGGEPFYILFGPVEADSADPFLEPLVVPGDPVALSRLAEEGAKKKELTALAFFIAGFSVNALLTLFIIASFYF